MRAPGLGEAPDQDFVVAVEEDNADGQLGALAQLAQGLDQARGVEIAGAHIDTDGHGPVPGGDDGADEGLRQVVDGLET